MVLFVASVPLAVATTFVVATVVAPVILEALLVLVRLALILIRLNLRLGASQVDRSAVDVRLLHVLDQVLSDRLIFESHKAKATARIRVRVLDNLNFFDDPVLAEKALQLILS